VAGKSSEILKFLCDVMLADLGKWLRAAGYDTSIAEKGKSDFEIYEEAVKDDRLLVTCDRDFLIIPQSDQTVVWLQGANLEEYVQNLKRRADVDWLFRPFSRCMLCNHLLFIAEGAKKENVPPDVREKGGTIWYCPNCQKAFWEGSHTKHMLQKLSDWQK
jgi:uncharacterized protein with PIN domain